jgi:hypothetical protein
VVDTKCAAGIELIRDIMCCEHIQKMVWGAESDVSCMIHQRIPYSLDIVPVNVIDIQLMYTKNNRLLGMKRALNNIRQHEPALLKALPSKDIINWNESYSKNKEALPYPLNKTHITYSVDDLHRIEIITSTPHNHIYTSWEEAFYMTQLNIQTIQLDVYGMRWFYRERKNYLHAVRTNKPLTQRLQKLVVIQRHIMSLKILHGDMFELYLSPCDVRHLTTFEHECLRLLIHHNVHIPADLSFVAP